MVWLDGAYTTDIDVTAIHSDAIAHWYDGLVYVVNRTPADNIQVLDPGASFSTIRQYSTGNGTNPQDIAFRSPTKAYIPLYERNEILIMDPTTGAHEGIIDLSAFADADGLCANVDVCPFDPDNDADGDGICGDVDVCPFDPTDALIDRGHGVTEAQHPDRDVLGSLQDRIDH